VQVLKEECEAYDLAEEQEQEQEQEQGQEQEQEQTI
jgi:hypothetical protein